MLETDTRCFVHHMKGLFDPTVLAQVRDYFDAVESSRQAQIGGEHEQARLRIGASTDAFRLDPRWYDPWRALPVGSLDRIRPFTWLLYPVMIRHLREDGHLVPWHQDIAYVRRMSRAHHRVITCFVPLEPDPAATSSLEFAVGDFQALEHREFGDHGAGLENDFADTVRFDLSFGDALVFGDHTPHRTVPAASGRIERRSFEFRAVIPAEALADKDYFDVERLDMVRSSS